MHYVSFQKKILKMARRFLLFLLLMPFFNLGEKTHAEKLSRIKSTGAGKKGSDYQNDEDDIYQAYGSQESNDTTSK